MNVDLSGLDPEAISALPALAPPHGVTPNFINPPSIENLAKGFIYTWLPIMVCFVGLRGYSRAKYSNGFGYDDWTSFFGALATIVYFVLILLELGHPLGRHLWDIRLINVPKQYSMMTTVKFNLYAFTAMIVKISLLLLYFRYFKPSAMARYMIWFGLVTISLFYVSNIVASLIFCIPRMDENWTSPSFEARCEMPELSLSYTQGVFNIISDFYILTVPLIQVVKLHVSTSKKIGLGMVFLTGLVACILSIVSCVFRFRQSHKEDTTWTLVPVYAFTFGEICIGIISSCMPVNFVLFKGLFRALSSRISSLQSSRKQGADKIHDVDEQSGSGPPAEHGRILPPVPKGTMVTLRSIIKNVFSSSVERSTKGTSEKALTDMSSFDEGKDEYHAHLRQVESAQLP